MPDFEEKSGNAGNSPEAAAPALPGSADDDPITRGILADAIKRSGMSREQIAEKMSYLTSRQISAGMLFDFTAESKASHRFPFAWARAFCQATGDMRLIEHIAEQTGFLLIRKDDADVIALGELVAERHRIDNEVARHARNVLERRTRL